MRWDCMFIAATAAHLPERVPLADAIATGRYPAEEAARTQMTSYTRAPVGASSVELAAIAAQAAMDETPEDIVANLNVLYHACTAPPGGPPAWNAAAKLHEMLQLEEHVMPFGITNGCAIGLAAVEEACLRLAGNRNLPGSALIAASEVWPRELVTDPLTALPGLVLAEGAAAVIISTVSGIAAILSTAGGVVSALADASRGAESLTYDPHATINLADRITHFFENTMPHDAYRQMRDGLRARVIAKALKDAGVALHEVDAFVLTNSGLANLRNGYFRMYPGIEHATHTGGIALEMGHVGAADWFAGLDALIKSGALKTGDKVLMTGGGGGWIEAAVLLQML
jgi:3-oxoacyl-[acyl-carrier-protein] synthase-3